jgi:hypothetical protein
MEIKKLMTKLTPAQAYAAQVRADRRAAALERRGSVIAADNARVNELFENVRVAQPKKVKKTSSKKVRWTDKEYDLIIDLYLKYVDGINGVENGRIIHDEFNRVYDTRSEASLSLQVAQIKGLDAYHPAEGMKDTSQTLIDKLFKIDPVRFPGRPDQEDKIQAKIDALLNEVRG